MLVRLYKYNTESDGTFYRILQSNSQQDERVYAKRYLVDVCGNSPDLLWEEQFNLDEDGRRFVREYLANTDKYSPVDVPDCSIHMCFKSDKPLLPYQIAEFISHGNAHYSLALVKFSDGFYSTTYSSYDIPIENCHVWVEKFANLSDAHNFVRFIYNKCTSVRKRAGGNPLYVGFEEVYKFNVDDISFDNLSRLMQGKKSIVDDKDIPF